MLAGSPSRVYSCLCQIQDQFEDRSGGRRFVQDLQAAQAEANPSWSKRQGARTLARHPDLDIPIFRIFMQRPNTSFLTLVSVCLRSTVSPVSLVNLLLGPVLLVAYPLRFETRYAIANLWVRFNLWMLETVCGEYEAQDSKTFLNETASFSANTSPPGNLGFAGTIPARGVHPEARIAAHRYGAGRWRPCSRSRLIGRRKLPP